MKVVLFGSTGGTGKNTVSKALDAGHQVVARRAGWPLSVDALKPLLGG